MKLNKAGQRFSRRDFLKLAGLGLGGLAFRTRKEGHQAVTEFHPADQLGRITVGKTELKLRPDSDSQTIGPVYANMVVAWLRETVGWNPNRVNQRWVETPDGYIWAPYLQPVRNSLNAPLTTLVASNGMWVEVTLPYIDLILDNPPARSPGLVDRIVQGLPPRLYYSQVVWVVQVKTDRQGQMWYRVNERYGAYGDILWAAAEAFRPLTSEEIAPIHPEVEDKRIEVNVAYQTLSCFEGRTEVYFARVSTGILQEGFATPIGEFPIWRKLISVHMSGGSTGGGWDLPGVAWTSLFVGTGVAIHSTYWHNNFGEPMSHGCVNARPEDSKWIFRWALPVVTYEPGDITVQMPGGTSVQVIEM
jgi:L,D-transpeptidase catalytic domain